MIGQDGRQKDNDTFRTRLSKLGMMERGRGKWVNYSASQANLAPKPNEGAPLATTAFTLHNNKVETKAGK